MSRSSRSNEKGKEFQNFAQKPALSALRKSFRILGMFAPGVGARLAYRLFFTPQRHPTPPWERRLNEAAEKLKMDYDFGTLNALSWGDGPTLLLIHGWGGRATQMGAFVNPLISAGFRVVALDAPAHGASSGKQTDMIQYAAAINAIRQQVAPVTAIIAHSLGAGCTLLAMERHQFKVEKLVLIGTPASAVWVTEAFAEVLGIPEHVIKRMRTLLERRYGNTFTWEHDLSIESMLSRTTIPTLLIHDKLDAEIPYWNALKLAKSNPKCELITSEGQGHRRILRHDYVISKCLEFLQLASTSRMSGLR
jgi:pimeloyl-ACP methyl ester carboxylesterase